MAIKDRETVKYWLWLSLICSPGSTYGEILLDYFDGDICKVYNAGQEEYSAVNGLNQRIINSLCDKSLDETDSIINYCRENGVAIIYPGHSAYPKRLCRIHNKPLVLYFKGVLPDMDDNVCIAAVGTRRMTEYGERTAYTMSYDLARGGAVIVSGMAGGIDGMCHRGCLDAGGYTVAVLGCGIDRAYPAENARLMREIMGQGAVVTEYKPFTPPYGKNFPIRNRIISGMSQAALVIEADNRSGALITAKDALLQGRDLFAMPGKIGEANSTGTNQLIKDGARIVTNAADILSEYAELYPHRINMGNLPFIRSKRVASPIKSSIASTPDSRFYLDYDMYAARRNNIAKSAVHEADKKTNAAKNKSHSDNKKVLDSKAPDNSAEEKAAQDFSPENLDPTERRLYDMMPSGEAVTPDSLTRGGMSVNEIMSTLTMLELKNAVRALPGGMFIKA